MNSARVFTPENHLARHMRGGGPTSAELIADADKRVSALADSIRGFVIGKLQEIRPFADQNDDDLFAASDVISGLAMNIAEVGDAAGLNALAEVTRGMVTMIDGLRTLGVWHTDALRLHIRALGLLSPDAPPLSRQDEARIVKDLQNMRRSIGLTE